MTKIDFRASTYDGNLQIEEADTGYYKEVIRLIVDQLSKNLILDSLESIVIPENYKIELFNFQNKFGISVGFTENEMGVGHAMTMTFLENDKEKKIIFIDKKVAFFFIDENKLNSASDEIKIDLFENRQLCINLLHHELVHVHEYEMLKMLKFDHKSKSINSLDNLLREFSQNIWSEYFACRLASATCTENNIKSEVENLLIQIKKVENKVKEEIIEYRSHGKINILVPIINERVDLLLKYTAYLHGKLYRFGDSRAELVIVINDILKDTILFGVWANIGNDLNTLFNNFPKWEDDGVFDCLNENVKIVMNKLNIYLESCDEGVYYYMP